MKKRKSHIMSPAGTALVLLLGILLAAMTTLALEQGSLLSTLESSPGRAGALCPQPVARGCHGAARVLSLGKCLVQCQLHHPGLGALKLRKSRQKWKPGEIPLFPEISCS